MTDKHEWRKREKSLYLPKQQAVLVEVPTFKFLSIEGEGNPNGPAFSQNIETLYSLAYGIKMTAKKLESKPHGYQDFTVYPLEGIWTLNAKAIQNFDGTFNKDDLVYRLMIRQPEFVEPAFFEEIREAVKAKKAELPLDKVIFEPYAEGQCVQMLHVGPFEDEPQSFEQMEQFAKEQGLSRVNKQHREIYLSDFRKVTPDKYKTVLRFQVR